MIKSEWICEYSVKQGERERERERGREGKPEKEVIWSEVRERGSMVGGVESGLKSKEYMIYIHCIYYIYYIFMFSQELILGL